MSAKMIQPVYQFRMTLDQTVEQLIVKCVPNQNEKMFTSCAAWELPKILIFKWISTNQNINQFFECGLRPPEYYEGFGGGHENSIENLDKKSLSLKFI